MSDSPQWTAEQRAGIETTGVDLLVSAAAGSGKTAVLSERCAYLVCDAAHPCDVDQLLVVTFTEPAAAEMKSRIEAAMRKRLDQNPVDVRLQTQIAQIDRAQVSTLHGFCSRALHRHFHLLDLDPSFTVLDGDEAKLLRLEVVRDLFADRYETDEGGTFQRLVDVHGDGDDEGLRQHLIRTHELLCSVIDPAAWIAEARRRISEGAHETLADGALGRELAAIVRRRLDAVSERCASALSTLRRMEGFGKYIDDLVRCADTIEQWKHAFGAGDFDTLAREVSAYEPSRKASIRNDTPGKAAAEAALDPVRKDLGKDGPLFALLRFSSREWAEGLKTVEPFARVFLDLVEHFQERYKVAKQRSRRLDFSDLERLTLKILRAEDGSPSAVARAYHRQFAHVLVDEYQDINGVQEAILHLVSRECLGLPTACAKAGHATPAPNLFCVGDVKQSIYGFRLAEPARFLDRYDRFKTGRSPGRVIDLQANFRSRGPLLEALNALFERLMTKEAADLAYDESQKLRPAATFPPDGEAAHFIGAPVELHLLPREVAPPVDADEEAGGDLDRSEREASFIACRMHQMMGHDGSPRMHVADKGADGQPLLRPIAFRDIVILLRSTVYKAEQFADVLRRHQIPVHRDSGTGYFNSAEIRDMLSLLHVLDNGRQDIPLAAVLRSPLAGLAAPEDSLARIRLAYRDASDPIPFHEAVGRYAKEQGDELAARLRDFQDDIDRWRTTARLRPLADLIWRILDDTGYLSFCSGLDNGAQRCANLLYLHDRAKQFGTFARQGLYRFLRFLEELQAESDLGMPSVLGAGEDVVRIMSVHRSKGLEFPVVFLPDLGKRINLRDSTGRVLVDRARYLGLPAVDELKQVRYPSLASVLVSERLRQQAIAEELRVLYVATTRAKEHLILVGTCDASLPERWHTLYGSHAGPLPADVVLGSASMLDWIGPAATAIQGAGANAFAIMSHSPEEVNDWSLSATSRIELTPQQAAYAALKPLDPPPPANGVAEEVIRRLAYRYEFAPYADLRAELPVTEWAKRNFAGPALVDGTLQEPEMHGDAERASMKSDPTARLLSLPRAIAGEIELGASDKGTATHLVLEHLDFSHPCHPQDLREQMEWMQRRKLITEVQAAAVDLGAIEWFAHSEIGDLIRHAAREDVLREVAFNLALPSEQFVGGSASTSGLDQVMLRGRIDLLVRSADSYLIVDYKTDQVSGAQIEHRKASYERQVQIYRQAIERLTKQRVGAVYLIFLWPRVICAM